MELIVITPDITVEGEVEMVNKMLASGLQRLHIRKPAFSLADYSNYLKAIESVYHSQIVIHGHFELFGEFGLGGIHLNTSARKDTSVGNQIQPISPSVISASFHSWQEILENEFHYGYVFISPVFNSISKPGYEAAIDLKGASETRQKILQEHRYCPQIMGLGGVGAEQLKILAQYGFDGGAMLGAIWESAYPDTVLLQALSQAKKFNA